MSVMATTAFSPTVWILLILAMLNILVFFSVDKGLKLKNGHNLFETDYMEMLPFRSEMSQIKLYVMSFKGSHLLNYFLHSVGWSKIAGW